MNKTIKVILLVLLALSVTAMSFAYAVSQIKTNDQLIQIGGADADSATLTALYDVGTVLIPKTKTATQPNEVYQLQWQLTVSANTYMEYTLDTELLPEFTITTNREAGVYTYNTATTYIITLELEEEVDYNEYTFYLYVNFK